MLLVKKESATSSIREETINALCNPCYGETNTCSYLAQEIKPEHLRLASFHLSNSSAEYILTTTLSRVQHVRNNKNTVALNSSVAHMKQCRTLHGEL